MAVADYRQLHGGRLGEPGQPNPFITAPKDVYQGWAELLNLPRVIKGSELAAVEGGQYQLRQSSVEQMGAATLILFFLEFPGGSVSQRHSHMNEAVFYILEGKGHELHDDEKFEWEAGDVVIIPAGCVHRHVNDDPEHPAKALVINPKPVYFAFNLMAQRLVDRPGEGPTEPLKEREKGESWR